MAKKKPVIVLNSSFEVLGRTTFNEALKKIYLNEVYVLVGEKNAFAQGPETPDGGRVRIPWPQIVVHNEYQMVSWEKMEPPSDVLAARMAVLNRDGFICQYCGDAGSTYDHIMPQSRGGENTWLNLVAACTDCNGYKADRTPEEAGMKLIREPFVPQHNRYAKEQKDVWKLLASGAMEGMDNSED